MGYNRDACEEYVQGYDRLMEVVLWLQLLGAGPPMRGTEIASLQLRSTATDNGQVFVFEDEILLVGSHNKANKARGAHAIPRFVAPPVSAILIDALAILRPVYEEVVPFRLEEQGAGAGDLNALYLRRGKRLSSDDVGDIITRGFDDFAGLPRVSRRIWRQCFPFFFRDRFGPFAHEEALLAHLADLALCVLDQWGKMDGEGGDADAWMRVDDVNDVAVRVVCVYMFVCLVLGLEGGMCCWVLILTRSPPTPPPPTDGPQDVHRPPGLRPHRHAGPDARRLRVLPLRLPHRVAHVRHGRRAVREARQDLA